MDNKAPILKGRPRLLSIEYESGLRQIFPEIGTKRGIQDKYYALQAARGLQDLAKNGEDMGYLWQPDAIWLKKRSMNAGILTADITTYPGALSLR